MSLKTRRWTSLFGSSKRTEAARQEARKRRGMRKLFMEPLEDRRLLATLSESGTTLTINLDNTGDQVGISSSGSTYKLTSTNNFVNDVTNPVAGANVSGFGTTTATVTAAGLAAYDTINVFDSAQDTRFTFRSGTFSDNFTVAMNADTAIGAGELAVGFDGALSFSTSNVTVSTTRNIAFAPISVTTVDFTSGNLSLQANTAGTTTGDFLGIRVSSTTINSTTGNITLKAVSNGPSAVVIGESTISSTGVGGSAATITIEGSSTGGASVCRSSTNVPLCHGIEIKVRGRVTSAAAAIEIKGVGNDNGLGILLTGMSGSGSLVTSTTGAIKLTGQSTSEPGIRINESATVETTLATDGQGNI